MGEYDEHPAFFYNNILGLRQEWNLDFRGDHVTRDIPFRHDKYSSNMSVLEVFWRTTTQHSYESVDLAAALHPKDDRAMLKPRASRSSSRGDERREAYRVF